MTDTKLAKRNDQSGLTMVELMVALAIGSFLIIGAVQVYNQSRQSFVINESIAKVQETAQFAMDTIEADLRMVNNWGRHSRGTAVEGRALPGDADPVNVNPPADCGATWVLDLSRPLEGSDNSYNLICNPVNGVAPQANSDTLTTRRTTVALTAPAADGRLRVQSTRVQGQVFVGNAVPPAFNVATSETHDLLVNTYYVAADSALIPGVPTLRRKSLAVNGGAAIVEDQEVAPGVENLQLHFGVDVDADNTVDRYVNPGNGIITPGSGTFVPAARIITARVWLVVRSLSREVGLNDNTTYQVGNANLGTPNDEFRRLQVSKTILLRNART